MPPNILFVLVDQMRWHAMGCAGNEQIRTPNLDRLAGTGASCDLAVSNIAVCTPARACLLTGRWPLSNTVLTNNSMLPPGMPGMGSILKAAGYDTGYIGKWHLAGEAYIGQTRWNHGQHGWVPPGEMRHGWDYWAVHHCTHDYRHPTYFRDKPEPIRVEGWEPDVQTDLALDFIAERAGADRPFALVVGWGTPHTPFIAPPAFRGMYAADTVELRPNVRIPDDGWPKPDSAGIDADNEAILREWTASYYAAVSNIDANLGRLLTALEDHGIADDTLVVFTSDHGEMLGSHGQLHKLQPWDESIRIPLLFRLPGRVVAGRRLTGPVNLVDVLPTCLDLLRIPGDPGIEGDSLASVLSGAPEDERSALLVWPCSAVSWGKQWTDLVTGGRGMPANFMRPYRGLRTRRWTYVRDRHGPWFLYDNEADPFQMRNLVEEGAGVPPALDAELDAWLDRTGDGFEATSYYRDLIELETGRCLAPEKLRTR